MSGQIVRLSICRRSHVCCPHTGFRFPQLYRLTGYYFKLKPGRALLHGMVHSRDDLVPDMNAPVDPIYTLDPDQTEGVALPQVEPIHQLDRSRDRGTLYLRHHSSAERLDAYIDAVCDTETYARNDRWSQYHIGSEWYSLLHCDAVTEAGKCAIVYVTKVPDSLTDGSMDWTHMIGADGHELAIDDLVPGDILDDISPVQKLINESITSP